MKNSCSCCLMSGSCSMQQLLSDKRGAIKNSFYIHQIKFSKFFLDLKNSYSYCFMSWSCSMQQLLSGKRGAIKKCFYIHLNGYSRLGICHVIYSLFFLWCISSTKNERKALVWKIRKKKNMNIQQDWRLQVRYFAWFITCKQIEPCMILYERQKSRKMLQL